MQLLSNPCEDETENDGCNYEDDSIGYEIAYEHPCIPFIDNANRLMGFIYIVNYFIPRNSSTSKNDSLIWLDS